MNKLALIFCTLMCSGSAFAEIYKCTDSKGNTSFQAQPCAPNLNTEWRKETEPERHHRLEQERIAEQLRLKKEQQAEETISKNVSSFKTAQKPVSSDKSEKDFWDEVETPDEVKQATYSHLDIVLRDPDSLKDLEWVQTLDGIGEYKSLISYRATNAYGGYVRSEKVIRVNRDSEVIGFEDYVPIPLWMQ